MRLCARSHNSYGVGVSVGIGVAVGVGLGVGVSVGVGLGVIVGVGVMVGVPVGVTDGVGVSVAREPPLLTKRTQSPVVANVTVLPSGFRPTTRR